MMNRVLYGKKDHIGVLAVKTLNCGKDTEEVGWPEAEIRAAAEAVDKDRDIYALIVKDMAWNSQKWTEPYFSPVTVECVPAERREMEETAADRVRQLRVPVIAAVSGEISGEGRALVMACDIRIAGETAGLVLEDGRRVSAQEACKKRLINSVFAFDALMDEAADMASLICRNAPIAVQEIKRCVDIGLDTDMHTGLAFEQQAFSLCNSTRDKEIGMRAFLNQEEEKHFVNR